MGKNLFLQPIVFNATLLMIILSILGCKSKIDKQKELYSLGFQILTIKQDEKKMSAFNNLFEKYYNYVEEYPDDSMSSVYLYEIATHEFIAKDGNRCIAALNRIISKFPNFRDHSFCMYLKGYTFEHLLHNPDSARMAYLLFIYKYPKNSRAKNLYNRLISESQLHQTDKLSEPEPDFLNALEEYNTLSDNYIPSAEEIKSLLIGKWVLDSSTFTPTMDLQKDPKFLKYYKLKNNGRIRSDGQAVTYYQKSYIKKRDFYTLNEYTGNGRLIIQLIYDWGKKNEKHFDLKDEYSFVVNDSTITYSFVTNKGKTVEFKSIIRKLTSDQLIYRGEDIASTDQIFYFSRQK